ncbi:MAG TPA: hypothetical protein VGE11_24740 [Pseudonocardia sp.]
MVAVVILVVLMAIAAAAPRYGVDSRNGIGTRRASPAADLRAVARALSRGARLIRR